MSNEFNAKNGLIIQYTQPVSGISNTTIINDDNSLVTEGQIYRELTGKTSNSVFDIYTATTAVELSGITNPVFSTNNQNMVGNTTISDGDLATNLGIVDIPTSRVRVFINGVEYNVGIGEDCYFKKSTSPFTVRNNGEEQQGDKLYWNGSIAQFQLDSGDTVDFIYLINGMTYTGSTSITEGHINTAAREVLTGLTQEVNNDIIEGYFKAGTLYRSITHNATATGDQTFTLINNASNVVSNNAFTSGIKTFVLPIPSDTLSNECQFIFKTGATVPTFAITYQSSPYPSALYPALPTLEANKLYFCCVSQFKNYAGTWEANFKFTAE